MRSLIQDGFRALRALRSRPGYLTISVATLALGIGATTAVFSVVDALMLRPMVYADAARVVNFAVHANGRPANGLYTHLAWREFQQRTDVFEGVEAFIIANRVMTGGAEPLALSLLDTSPGLLHLLGVAPQLGRYFNDDDGRGATGPVVVISDGLWREQFGADPEVVGKPITLNDVAHTVIGVMPRGFAFPRVGLRAWTLLSGTPPARPSLELVGRLRQGVSFEQAAASVTAMRPQIAALNGVTQGRDAALEQPENITQSQRTPIYMLFGAVLLVLAIACANVASMALANGSVRQREFAVCAALGASRARVARQLLMESAIVSLLGGAAGVWLALASVQAISPLVPIELAFFNANEIRVDNRVLIFATLISIVTAMIAGVVPALRGSHVDVGDVLKGSGRTSSASATERRALSTLAVVQCAIAVLLLTGAGLLMQSFLRLQAVDPGFDTRNLVVLSLQLPRARYADAAAQVALRDALARELAAVPAVLGVTIAGGFPPRGGGFHFGVDLETNATSGVAATDLEIAFTAVSPEYFTVMGIELLAGRVLSPTEPIDNVVVSEVLARRYWGSPEHAIGGRFRVSAKEPWLSIVGVVADVKQMGLDDRLGDLEYYHPWPRTGSGGGSHAIAIRTTSESATLVSTLKSRVWSVDPKLPIRESKEMHALIAESIGRPRFFFILMTVFAAVAAAVAAAGIYGLFSYAVTRRTHEIGIRLAVGSTPRQVGGLIIRQTCALASIGAVLGLAGAWFSSRAIRSLLFQTTSTDPMILAGGAMCLILLALVASAAPTRRAMRVDPLVMLKVE